MRVTKTSQRVSNGTNNWPTFWRHPSSALETGSVPKYGKKTAIFRSASARKAEKRERKQLRGERTREKGLENKKKDFQDFRVQNAEEDSSQGD